MNPALSLAHLPELPSATASRIRVLEAHIATIRAALEKVDRMTQALMPTDGRANPVVVDTLGLSAISAVCQAALLEEA